MNPLWFFVGFFAGAGQVPVRCAGRRRRADEGSSWRSRDETAQLRSERRPEGDTQRPRDETATAFREREDEGSTQRVLPPECANERAGVK